jgi:hypothetical protein
LGDGEEGEEEEEEEGDEAAAVVMLGCGHRLHVRCIGSWV